MDDKILNMHKIFMALSDGNKDIVILIAKSIKIAQDITAQSFRVLQEEKGEGDELQVNNNQVESPRYLFL